jgi:hypothetical protein
MPNVLYRFQSPKPLSVSKVRGYILNTLKKYEKELLSAFEEIVEPFEHDVAFESEIGYEGGNYRVAVYTTDEIFQYLEYGTSVRYATMAPGFVRKTNPGSLVTGPGSGPSADWVLFVDTNTPHEGIEARYYSGQLRDKLYPQFADDIDQAIALGLRP